MTFHFVTNLRDQHLRGHMVVCDMYIVHNKDIFLIYCAAIVHFITYYQIGFCSTDKTIENGWPHEVLVYMNCCNCFKINANLNRPADIVRSCNWLLCFENHSSDNYQNYGSFIKSKKENCCPFNLNTKENNICILLAYNIRNISINLDGDHVVAGSQIELVIALINYDLVIIGGRSSGTSINSSVNGLSISSYY